MRNPPFIANCNGDSFSIGQIITLLQRRGSGELLEVAGETTVFLFDVTANCTSDIRVRFQTVDEEVGQIISSKIKLNDGRGNSVAVRDRDSVGGPITRVKDDTGDATRGVEGQHSLHGEVEGGDAERFEHDLGRLLTNGVLGERRLGQKDGAFFEITAMFGIITKQIAKSTISDLLHGVTFL